MKANGAVPWGDKSNKGLTARSALVCSEGMALSSVKITVSACLVPDLCPSLVHFSPAMGFESSFMR